MAGGPGGPAGTGTTPVGDRPGAHVRPVVFRPSLASPVLALGRSAVVTAAVAVAFVIAGAAGAGWLRASLLVVLVLGVVVTLGLGLRVLLRAAGRGPRLVLDADGWTNTTGRTPRRVAWTQIRRLSAVTEGGRMLLVADLVDGRVSTVLLRRLGRPGPVVEQAVRDRLNDAHGLTRLT